MTEQTRQEIRESFKSFFTKHIRNEIQDRVDIYNYEYRIDGEPEMTFDEMAGLFIEKLTTYRGKQ
jgi:hypothetical protein